MKKPSVRQEKQLSREDISLRVQRAVQEGNLAPSILSRLDVRFADTLAQIPEEVAQAYGIPKQFSEMRSFPHRLRKTEKKVSTPGPRKQMLPDPDARSRTDEEADQQCQFLIPDVAAKSQQEWKEARQQFFRDAPPAEVARFRQLEEEAQQNGGLRQIVNGRLTEEWLWMTSIQLWNDYCEQGEQVVLNRLPYLFIWDCAFFLRQWWVSDLIASWCQAGEREKIEFIFFGSTGPKKPGVNGFSVVIPNYDRNMRIYVAVKKLQSEGYSDRKAYEKVAPQFLWGRPNQPKKPLSPSAVKKIYEEVEQQLQPPSDNNRRSRIPHSPKTPFPKQIMDLFSDPPR